METIEILKDLQDNFGISREELAVACKVSHMTIFRWTKGETTPSYGEQLLLQQIYDEYKAKPRKK